MPNSEEGVRPPVPGVTVVVPAYNVGPYLERCLDSLVAQTLDRAQYDVIVVDDGSTDGTGERLDRAAEAHPDLVTVVHIPNSGWPGRPRNIGTDLSTREYVFYCDADDWLLPHALEIMLQRAVADRADVLMARPVGIGRAVPIGVYSRGDRCTTWRESPAVFTNLTCQKLFRREFLREKQLRFGEGRVRLEDFQFMTAAYLRAERISIVGSRPCYVFERREDGGNLTAATTATEDEYYASVETILDIILADTEPGPDQDIAFDRVVRSELLGHVSRPTLLERAPAEQRAVFEHARRLLRDTVPPSAIARLDPLNRDWARRVLTGDLDSVLRRITAREAVTVSLVVDQLSWSDEVLTVRLAVALLRDGEVVCLEREADAWILRDEPDQPGVDVGPVLDRAGVLLRMKRRAASDEWPVAVSLTRVDGDDPERRRLAWTGTVRLDVRTQAGGRPLATGVWDIRGALHACGYERSVRLQAPGPDQPEPPSSIVGDKRVRPYWGQAGALVISIREAPAPAAPAARPQPTSSPPESEHRMVTNLTSIARTRARRLARRAAMRLVTRAGLTVTRVGRGMVIVSRARSVDVAPLAPGRSWVVSKRAGGSAPPVPVKLSDAHWLVPVSGEAAAALDVRSVGSRGWLVSRPDSSPLAEVTLENQTLQHLATRHVTWLLARYDVDLVLDVGANTGQYGQGLRRSGYRGRIESFEPVPRFADAVDTLAAGDPNWRVHRIALGSTEGTVPIRVQRTFSSLLPASDYGKGRFSTLREFADRDEQVVDVALRRLDSVLGELLPEVERADGGPPRVFLKMDTQGFDLEAFKGLGEAITSVVGLQSEVALLLIYDGMPRMPEAVATYEAAGFELSGLYPVTTEPDGRVIEYDCLMVRASAAP